jgi:hypothetical protein
VPLAGGEPDAPADALVGLPDAPPEADAEAEAVADRGLAVTAGDRDHRDGERSATQVRQERPAIERFGNVHGRGLRGAASGFPEQGTTPLPWRFVGLRRRSPPHGAGP